MTVTFDLALTAGPLNAGNWALIFNGTAYGAIAALASGNKVTVNVEAQGPAPPGALTAYTATPPDVLSAAGTPAAAFTDFPVQAA